MTAPKKIYISGPISGRPNGNRDLFDRAAISICKDYNYPINPHTIGAYLPAGSSWLAYMRVCIAALAEADAVLMLPGWLRSRGARLEWFIAWRMGLKITYWRGE